MKVGDLVKRCPRFWNSLVHLTDDERSEIGIIVEHDVGPRWNQREEYFVVMWPGSEGLDWRIAESLEVQAVKRKKVKR